MIRPLLDRLGWKLLSLAIAVVLWAAFVSSPELVTSISAPIEFQNMPPDLELSSRLPERVYLEVQGQSSRLHHFDPSLTAVILNLSSVNRPGEHTFTIERRNIDLPAGLTLMRALPSQVRLRFEQRLAADVPVKVRFSGLPPAGYRVSREEVRPQTLRIIGPESRVKQVGYAETDPIDLSHAVSRAEFRVHTFVADSQVRLVSSPVVQVVITLEKTAPGEAPSDGQGTVRN